MVFINLLGLFFLVLICTIGPGFLISDQLRLMPLETFCLSLAFSYLIIYLASFAVYCIGLPAYSYFILSGIFFFVTITQYRKIYRLLSSREVIKPFFCFIVLLIWCLSLVSLVRHFSGGLWAGDWLEHYERSTFFLEHSPLNKRFLGLWLLPARPPLMNILASFFMGQVGRHYYIFQVIFCFLNVSVFLSCCLMGTLFKRKNRNWIVILTALFMLNPMLLQNVSFTWTKLFTSYFVILGLYFYIKSLRDENTYCLVLAFVNLSAGYLVHFSAGPYALFLVLHYLFFVFWKKGPERWREAFLTFFICSCILFSWFGWSLYYFGVEDTFFSNSTYMDSVRLNLYQNIIKVSQNIFYTVIPHPLRGVSLGAISQSSFLGFMRDSLFFIYQTNLIFTLGSIGGLLLIYILLRSLKNEGAMSMEKNFWILFIPFNIVVGIALHGAPDKFGLAHICLQTMVLLGLTFISVRIWGCSTFLKNLALIGLFMDYLLGVWVHFSLQNRIFRIIEVLPGQNLIKIDNTLSRTASNNWYVKEDRGLIFLGDFLYNLSIPIQVLLAVAVLLGLMHLGRRLNNEGQPGAT